MRSTTTHDFSMIPQANIQRSTFSRSHGFKTTFDSGYLVPFYVDEVLPGDTYAVSAHMFARFATLLVPPMDNMFLDIFYFFVPHRLVWSHFLNFMGEENAPGDYVNNVVSYQTPIVTTPGAGFAVGSLADYFGIPTGIQNLNGAGLGPVAFAFRAYNHIWNDWFRDENLQTKTPENMGDGPDAATDYVLKRRNKRHDYFTSALPWPQKGPGVTIPLSTGSLPIKTAGSALITGNQNAMFMNVSATGAVPPNNQMVTNAAVVGNNTTAMGTWANGLYPSNLYADLSAAINPTINSLRQAFQIQRLYERDARGGSRYTELVRSHFGVVSPDARLQRTEYLGGGTTRINITPIAQTTPTGIAGTTTALGDLGAMGTTSAHGIGFTKSFTEHGTIIGLMEARADLTYQQGLNKMWSRRTRFDFYWPVLANLGEQSILNQEIYANNSPGTGAAQDQGVFGYQERWAEYRYYPSLVTGQFRSTYATPLDMWHLAQKFTALPTLGDTFMQDTPPTSRVKVVTSKPDFILDSYLEVRATRPMPTYSVPGMIDHF